MVTTARHSTLGDVATIGHPVKYSATEAEIRTGAPTLGEHTREVLAEVGYSEQRIEELLSLGIAVSSR